MIEEADAMPFNISQCIPATDMDVVMQFSGWDTYV